MVSVRVAFVERSTGELVLGPPKSRAGVRAVALPAPVLRILAEHMSVYTGGDADALIFTGEKGGALRRSTFNRVVKWRHLVASIGVPALHFHDLRHTGNVLAASTGASLRDLMDRMGHDSMRAALIYQHATQDAGRKIADAMERMIAAEEHEGPDDEVGRSGRSVDRRSAAGRLGPLALGGHLPGR